MQGSAEHFITFTISSIYNTGAQILRFYLSNYTEIMLKPVFWCESHDYAIYLSIIVMGVIS